VGVQRELIQGVSIDVGYFRRNWFNLDVTDDRNLTAADFTFFDLVVPSHPDLPDGGGYTLTGLRTLTEAGFAKPEDSITLRAKEIGEFKENWQGVDVSVNARLQNGLQFQIGTSTGRTSLNDCDLVTGALADRDLARSTGFCDRSEDYLTPVKAYAVYTIPTIDVQVSGTFQSDPGNFIQADFVADNAYLAANSTLGGALAGGENNISVELAQPNTLRLDRRNLFDVRFGKVLRAAGARAVVSLDIFNALNTNAVLGVNETFSGAGGGPWLTPQEIVQARLMKVSLQFDW
jgi:hypothetical protein